MTCLFLAASSHALSPLNALPEQVPVIVDDAVKPYYDQLTSEQRNCEGQPARAIRVIREGQPVTMDFSATRLNIELDSNDNIVRVSCG